MSQKCDQFSYGPLCLRFLWFLVLRWSPYVAEASLGMHGNLQVQAAIDCLAQIMRIGDGERWLMIACDWWWRMVWGRRAGEWVERRDLSLKTLTLHYLHLGWVRKTTSRPPPTPFSEIFLELRRRYFGLAGPFQTSLEAPKWFFGHKQIRPTRLY